MARLGDRRCLATHGRCTVRYAVWGTGGGAAAELLTLHLRARGWPVDTAGPAGVPADARRLRLGTGLPDRLARRR
ncbi:hypothetical protein ACFFX1_04530 [Dactylosporangium sucinum]|uniref:Uncharacterized protein n=1 Tax=Dactylosporangium sucinum TaxID=1424081 RepID=A0A917U7J3_9ACTN|nr:hypothetical protein [Dactylosporangium sucinum]GGM59841.1 hypothetical protein GCM10007977_071710 [Dactylosporangium sucinum]